jgi:F-type H+-transporting ATPase subunit gamma
VASLRDIRKRIRSTKNTQQITKAMKMVSAAKLRKAQDAILAARPYAQQLDQMMRDLAARAESVAHPLLTPRPGKKVELLVLTSARGLAGGFNANVTRRALRFIEENKGSFEQVQVSTIGRKGNEFFKRRGVTLRKDFPGLMAKVTYRAADEIAQELAQDFLAGRVDAVYVVYNEFITAISQQVQVAPLLPFGFGDAKAGGKKEAAEVDFKYEPGREEVLGRLVPQALAIKIYRALLESVASEHGARMSAMESATNNASDMISNLTLTYNRTRQAVITKELMEIVSGAEALK